MLNNPGMFHSPQLRMEEAPKEYKEALKIDRELTQKNPKTYLPHLAKTLNNQRKLDNMQHR